MQCPVCHNEVSAQSAFCNSCGAPLATGGASASSSVPPPTNYTDVPSGYSAVPPAYVAAPPAATSSGLSENAAAAIAYLTIIPAIIFLLLEPYNKMPLVRFHSWQSIGLCVAAFVLQAIISFAEIAMHFVPGIILLFSLVHLVIGVGLFLIWLFIILKASKGEWYKLPVIGDFAEKQARG
ncbi:hypothetical protein [Tunturiibacter gelidoferens]|uniref:Putative membrane protein n=1 Tax=Tunturiibacter lichenicola TaxID=2051959 RepID=A0A7Y9NPQ9_9BACT|nr:hypothetical protein [Edaphobacter lichenicola]NYF53226.1 putative membrane protein [Edaphobacter lichenicola]